MLESCHKACELLHQKPQSLVTCLVKVSILPIWFQSPPIIVTQPDQIIPGCCYCAMLLWAKCKYWKIMENFTELVDNFSNFSCMFLNLNIFFQYLNLIVLIFEHEKLQEQVKKAFCYKKLFWPFTVWIDCSGDFKNLANTWPSASFFKSFSWPLEHFFS